MEDLLQKIKKCTVCEKSLPLGANPVVVANPSAKIAIVGQAPGTKVHLSGIPWDDQSGLLLRKWLNLSNEAFHDERKIAIVPMGFCYPGKGKSGDLPPRHECAPLWHWLLFEQMPQIKLTLLIGKYAQNYYLQSSNKKTLTETVLSYQAYLPTFFPLPHPSPRNRYWLVKNPWFEEKVLPELRKKVEQCLL